MVMAICLWITSIVVLDIGYMAWPYRYQWSKWITNSPVEDTYDYELVIPHWKELAFNDTDIFDRYKLTDDQIDNFDEIKQCIGEWEWFSGIREFWIERYGDEEQQECLEWKSIMKAKNVKQVPTY